MLCLPVLLCLPRGSFFSLYSTEQNYRAQVAFRERKRLYVKSLEDQLEQAMNELNKNEALRQENTEMRVMMEALRAENARLLAFAKYAFPWRLSFVY